MNGVRRLMIAPACLLLATSLHAADDLPPTASTTFPSSHAPVTNPALIADHYHQVLQRPEFQSSDELDVDTRFRDWLTQWFLHLGTKLSEFQYAQEMHNFSLLFITLLLIVALTGLLYLTFRFLRRRRLHDEPMPTRTPGQRVFLPPEYYDEAIRQALGARDWHAAWMVTWRQFLSRLENRHLVEADRTRTNREYLAQLRQQTLPSPALALLSRMVDAYDQFIYGRKPIDEPDWNLFHQQVDEATLLLHLHDKNLRAERKQGAA